MLFPCFFRPSWAVSNLKIRRFLYIWASPVALVVKNLPANAGDTGLIPGSGRSPGEKNGNPLSILVWEILWTEELGRLQSMGSQRIGHDLATK